MKKSKFRALLLAIVMVMSVLAVCGGAAQPVDRSQLNLTFVAPQIGNDYWEGVIQGVREGAAEVGVEVNIVSPGASFDLAA